MNDKGYMTIEASVVFPVVVFGVFVCILGMILVYEKGYVLSREYETLYTISLADIRNDRVETYLSEKDYSGGIVLGDVNVETQYYFCKAKCDGELRLYGTSEINAVREIDVRVDRLRRWQFYDDSFQDDGE